MLIRYLFICISFLFLLAACGSPSTTPNNPDPGNPDPTEPKRTTVAPENFHEIPSPDTETREVSFVIPGTNELITESVYVVNGYYLYQGDINIGTAGDEAALSSQSATLPLQNSFWPDGVVPYKIDLSEPVDGEAPDDGEAPEVPVKDSKSLKQSIDDAIAHWNKKTNITLREATDADGSYVLFRKGIKGSGCHSPLGFGVGERLINLEEACPTGTVIHEIGHAVGLWHEQMRSDRDTYVEINFDKIIEKQRHNFKKLEATQVQNSGAYDYGSIMHYPWYAFSTNACNSLADCQYTIRPKPLLPDNATPEQTADYLTLTDSMGQRVGLSAGDIEGIKALYPNKADSPNDPVGAIVSGQPARLVPSTALLNNLFGGSIAVSGNYAIVGNKIGNQVGSGEAYIFERTDEGWNEGQKLTLGEDGSDGDLFGASVAISGDYAIVGAPGFDGVDGETEDGGAAFIYERTTEGWTLASFLPGEAAGDRIGTSVGISGSYAILGAPGFDAEGEKTDAGRIYILERTTTGWSTVRSFDGEAAEDGSGASVAISGDYAIAGAPSHDLNDETANDGRIYIFERAAEGWSTVRFFDGSVASASLGSSVAISGDYAIAGSVGRRQAFTFLRGENNWALNKVLAPNDLSSGDQYASSVAISGKYAVVGANRARVNNASFAGSAYVFGPSNGRDFDQYQKLTADDSTFGDFFGLGVAISDSYILIGAGGDATRGVPNSGSVYVYSR